VTRFLAALSLALAAAGCAPAAAPPPHEIYVWQRAWTPTLAATLLQARRHFAAWRVLALQSDRNGALQPIRADAAALARAGLPVVAVVRLDGSEPAVSVASLVAGVNATLADWRAAGVMVRGVEIDHDCASAKLPAYAALLRELRAALARELRLSITALPAWLDSSSLRAVLEQADEAVLQVHAVRSPAQGLFDADLALRWVRAFAARSPHPFRVALPDYGARVALDADGAPVSVESEMPIRDGAADVREIEVRPADAARLLRALAAAPPPHFAGVVWFRLPLPEDVRSWSLATLGAVVEGRPLTPRIEVRTEAGQGGAVDLVAVNRGDIDAAPPLQVRVAARGCRAADAVSGYAVAATPEGWRFQRDVAGALRAGRRRALGWVNCAHVDKVEWDADP
jgi:hypothetical protein